MAVSAIFFINMAGYVLLLRAFHRERVFRDRTNPFDKFSAAEFKLRYRMSKASVNLLINEIRGNIVHATLRSKSVFSVSNFALKAITFVFSQ